MVSTPILSARHEGRDVTTPTSRGSGRRLLAIGVAAAVALLVVIGRLERRTLAPHPPAPLGSAPTTTLRPLPVTATVHLGAPAQPFENAIQLAAGEGGVWALLHGTLVHVDPGRNRVVARIRLGRPDEALRLLAVGAGAVWVGAQRGTMRIDPTTDRVAGVLRASDFPEAANTASLWSTRCASETGEHCSLLELDPRTLRVIARIRLPGPPGGPPVVASGSLWLTDRSGARVWRVDTASRRLIRLGLAGVQPWLPDSSSVLTVGEAGVWTLASVQTPTRLGSRVDVGLVRIDPQTNQVSAVTPLVNLQGTPPIRLAAGAGGVWVEGRHQGGALIVIDRVDPATGRLRGTVSTGNGFPAALVAGLGALWLARPMTGDLLRLDPAGM
jgi:hypothetical protein